MFGTPEAIREWRTRHLIDYRLVPGDAEADRRWDDRVVCEGNLLGAFEIINQRLTASLPTPFTLEGSTRIDQSPIHVALREALVNLLVHADYAESQASLIKRSPDGYLFRNPGSSRVSEVDLLTGDRSDPRNPLLVLMFRQIGLAEEAGTGLPKIIKSWQAQGFQVPAIDVGTERYEFTLHLRYVHLISDEDRAWLHSLGGNWNSAEQLALIHARHAGEVDNLRLRQQAGLHPADATKVLSGLRERGFLQMIGGGRGTRYQLGPSASVLPYETVVAGGRTPAANLKGTSPSSEGKGVSSEGTSPSSEGKGVNSEGTSPSSADKLPSPEDLWTELLEIARPARERRRLDPFVRDDIVVRLCARAPLSLHELTDLLHRSEPYIRETLRTLIGSGRLTFAYPDQPSHPHQKYVTTNVSAGGASPAEGRSADDTS